MKIQISVLSFALVALLFAACAKDDIPSTPEQSFDKEGILAHFDKSVFEGKVAYLGGLSLLDLRWVRARAMNQLGTSPEEAELLVIGASQLTTHMDVLRNAYDEGKFIIIGR